MYNEEKLYSVRSLVVVHILNFQRDLVVMRFIHIDGLAMGAPSSSIISEIFLQHTEHTHLPRLTQKHKQVNYFRYIDDVLLICDSQHTDIHSLLHDFISVHPNLQFTQEVEQNNTLNCMDITIHKTPMNIKISVYRKPTFTDTIIPYTSNHPTQHKYAAVRFLYNLLDAYQLHTAEYQHEENIFQNILHNNSFPILPRKPYPRPPSQPEKQLAKRKCATFKNTGRETTFITTLFKHTNRRIAYRTNNNLLRHLTQSPHSQDIYTHSGVYKLTDPDCGKAYIGQIDRDLRTRFIEHKRSFRHNTPTSKYARHLTTNRHAFGNIQDTMQILQFQTKGMHLTTIERFYIYKEASINNHLNDDHMIPNKKILRPFSKNFKGQATSTQSLSPCLYVLP